MRFVWRLVNQVSVISWRSAWLSVLLAEGLNCALYIAFALILRPQALDAFTTVRSRRHTTVGTPLARSALRVVVAPRACVGLSVSPCGAVRECGLVDV